MDNSPESSSTAPRSQLDLIAQKETRRQAAARWGSWLDERASLATTFRHSGWQRLRRRVYEALIRTRRPASQVDEYRHCGSHAYVLRSLDDPGIYRVAGSKCHNRWCLPCATERSRAISLNVREHIAGRTCRFLTLTTVADGRPLADRLRDIYDAFARLRRRKWWRRRVTGGIAMLEIKWSQASRDWHPHIHSVIEGRYLPQRELSKIWRSITKTSHIVDVRLIRDPRNAAAYVAKYASKPCNTTYSHEPDRLDEAIRALHGRKLVLTWGDWRGVTVTEAPSKEAWVIVATLNDVIARAAAGDDDSRDMLHALTTRDLTDLYASAPARPPPLAKPPPPQVQLSWHGVWQAGGSMDTPHDL